MKFRNNKITTHSGWCRRWQEMTSGKCNDAGQSVYSDWFPETTMPATLPCRERRVISSQIVAHSTRLWTLNNPTFESWMVPTLFHRHTRNRPQFPGLLHWCQPSAKLVCTWHERKQRNKTKWWHIWWICLRVLGSVCPTAFLINLVIERLVI